MTDEKKKNRYDDLPCSPIVVTKIIPEGGSARFEPLPEGAMRCTIIVPEFEVGREEWFHLMKALRAK